MPDSRSRQGHQRVHEQWAHLRFAVVGWLLAAPPEKGELRAAITDLAQRTWQHPTTGEPVRFGFSTIERWYYRAVAERTDPVGVLRRKVRCNAGQQHTVSDAVRRALVAQYAALRAGASNCITTISSRWPRRNLISSRCRPIRRCAASCVPTVSTSAGVSPRAQPAAPSKPRPASPTARSEATSPSM